MLCTAIYGLCAEGAEDIDELDASLDELATSSPVDDELVQAERRAALLAIGGVIGGG